MEIKNAQQTIITMDNKEFENLKELIKDNCTITDQLDKELRSAFNHDKIEGDLYNIVIQKLCKDYTGWSDLAWGEKYVRNVHLSYDDNRKKLYDKIQSMYRTSVKMPELFTNDELKRIKYEYGILLCFEEAIMRLGEAGQNLIDIECALDEGVTDDNTDWLFKIVDEAEGGNVNA